MSDDIREAARRWVAWKIPGNTVIKSTDPKFEELTGTNQKKLKNGWKGWNHIKKQDRHIVTTCNSFVGIYCVGINLPRRRELVADTQRGLFKLMEALKHMGIDAWVEAKNSKDWPKYGDIVLHQVQHVDISLDYYKDTNTWWSVDGGQHGPTFDENDVLVEDDSKSYDCIKRVEHKNPNINNLKGWLDLDRYIANENYVAPANLKPPPAPQPTYSEASLSLWLNQDDELAHPDAPCGGGGPGFSCFGGVLDAYPYVQDLPHPGAPGPLNVDMLAIRDFEKDRDEG